MQKNVKLKAEGNPRTTDGKGGYLFRCDWVLTLVVLNSASIQLIPSTVAAVRASFGCAQPFDIMPAVWGASILSVIVVIAAARLFALFWP